MFYRLDVDGERKQVVIKAENAVIASCIVSETLDHREVEYEQFKIFPEVDALNLQTFPEFGTRHLISKEFEFFEVWARK